jgi:hypothetical protein
MPEQGPHLAPREIARLCYEAGWTDSKKLCVAISVCIAESNGYPERYNDNPAVLNPDGTIKTPASRDRGLWMINDKAHPGISDAVAYDAAKATKAARQIYVGRGYKFTAWAAYNNGQYKDPKRNAMKYSFDAISNMLRLMNGYDIP